MALLDFMLNPIEALTRLTVGRVIVNTSDRCQTIELE